MIYLVLLLALAAQGAAGLLLWRIVRPQANAVESFGMSLALGTVTAVIFGILLQPWTQWGWVAPGAISLILYLIPRTRSALFGMHVQRDCVGRGLVTALVLGGFLTAVSFGLSVRNYPLAWEGNWTGFHGDMPFFEALSRSIPLLGPFDSIFSPGQMIHYHWLTYAWAGQLTTSLDAPPFLVLTRVLPIIAMVAGVSLVAAWTRRLTSAVWAPSLAVVLLLMGGHLGVVYGSVFNFDSPSQSLSVVWLIAFVVLVSAMWVGQPETKRFVPSLALLGILSGGLLLSKVSTGAVGMAVVVSLVVWQLIRRKKLSGQQVLIFTASLVSMLLAYFSFLAGGNGGGGITVGSLLDRASSEQGMNPTVGVLGVAIGTSILFLAITARWLGSLWLLTNHDWRDKPEFAVGLALVGAGAGSVVIFNGGQNELWFAAAAAGPLAALCAVGVANAWDYVLKRSKYFGNGFTYFAWSSIVVASVIVFGVTWSLWATGPSGGNVWEPTYRWLAPVIGIGLILIFGVVLGRLFGTRDFLATVAVVVVVATCATAPGRLLGVGTGQVGSAPVKRSEFFSVPGPAPSFIDQGDLSGLPATFMDAGKYVRNNSSQGEILVTNVTQSAIVPAVTGLQTVISGTWYQTPYGSKGEEGVLLERERLSYSFIDSPGAKTLTPLCELGVMWVWIDMDRTTQTDWSGYLTVGFRSDRVIVGRINQVAC